LLPDHPDKNKGSEMAADKFREITAAYEILGDFKLRKLYDKGLLHTLGGRHAQQEPAVHQKEDDPQTKFYKSRFRRTEATGRTPIYDFDEWSRMHYGDHFARKRAAQTRYEIRRTKEAPFMVPKEKLIVMLGMVLVMFLVNFYTDQKNDWVTKPSDLPPDKGKS
jgi:DnaJ homolog subfamily C member 30